MAVEFKEDMLKLQLVKGFNACRLCWTVKLNFYFFVVVIFLLKMNDHNNL